MSNLADINTKSQRRIGELEVELKAAKTQLASTEPQSEKERKLKEQVTSLKTELAEAQKTQKVMLKDIKAFSTFS